MMRRLATLALAALLLAPIARADDGPLRVRAELTAQSMNVTQRTTLTVTAELDQGWALVDDPFGTMKAGEAVGPLTVASSVMASPSRIEGTTTIRRWTVELAPDLPMTGEVPALRFKAQQTGGDRVAIVRTEPIPVTVESLLDEQLAEDWDPTALRPALGPLPVEAPSKTGLIIGAVAAGVIVLAGAFTLTLVSRRRGDPARARRRRLDACAEAARAIDLNRPIGEVAQALGGAVRRAMAERAGAPALAAIGVEMPGLCRKGVGLTAADTAHVCDFFARVDLAMYAGERVETDVAALRSDALRAIESVRLATEGGVYA